MDRPKTYFEGVLQLRNPTPAIIDFVADEVEKTPSVWIAKTKKLKNGIDLFLSSNKFLADIARKLKDNFTGEILRSNTLFSEDKQTSKVLYRGCYLFRYYDIKKGDKVIIRGQTIQIIAIGKELLAKDMETQRKVHIKFADLKDARIEKID